MRIIGAMKRTALLTAMTVLLLLALVVPRSIAPAVAQTGNGYDLTWNTVDGGGYTFSSGDGYTLGGTIGQPDTEFMQGGDYTLAGGFWGGGAAVEYKLYLPLVLRDYQ